MEGASAEKAEKAAKAFLEMQKNEMFIEEMKRLAAKAARTDHLRGLIAEEDNRVVSHMFYTRGISEDLVRARLGQRIISLGGGVVDERLIGRSMELPPLQGYFDVFMHGEPGRVFFQGKTAMNAERLAELVKAHPGWKEGMKIRLISCRTGAEAKGFAQQLASAMKTTVWAPNAYASAGSEGIGVVFKIGDGLTDLWGAMMRFTP
jgi:hypothetical protein